MARALTPVAAPVGEARILTFADADALARAGAARFAQAAREAVERSGRFAVALTGGGSPRELYRILGDDAMAAEIPWPRVHLFWGDERAVPPAHPRSNFGMAHERLVARVAIPPENVHRIHGELGARRAAERYDAELREFFGSAATFDLVHLGLGQDGHVASLFPFDHAALLERERWALHTLSPDNGEPRVTLTLPVLNATRRVEFLVPAADKADMARAVVRGPLDPFRIPAQCIRPAQGELAWLVTPPVAGEISRNPEIRGRQRP